MGSLPGVALGSSWKGAVRACWKDGLWPVAVGWNEGAGLDSQLIGKLGPEKEFQSSAFAFLVLSLVHRASLPSPTLSIPSGCTAGIGKWKRGCVWGGWLWLGLGFVSNPTPPRPLSHTGVCSRPPPPPRRGKGCLSLDEPVDSYSLQSRSCGLTSLGF